MNLRDCARPRKGRLRAAFLYRLVWVLVVLTLGGCQLANNNPMLKTITDLVPGGTDVSGAAARIEYATIDFGIAGRGGLLVLAETSGGLTFWQSSSRESVVLRDGHLVSTSGLSRPLRLTKLYEADSTDSMASPWQQAVKQPVVYDMLRTWERSDGTVDTGRARVHLTCASANERVSLPLTELTLQRCTETYRWQRGVTTSAVLWRGPEDHRIWAAETVPWPGAPRYSWKVARPWW